jgi:SAM-dependent methyltransferase
MTPDQEVLISRLLDRDRPQRTEADVQADVRDLLLRGGLNLDDEKLDVQLDPQVGGGCRIDVEVGTTVIETKKDLRAGNVRKLGVLQLQGYVEKRQRDRGGRYVGVLTDGAEWACFHLQGAEFVRASGITIVSAKQDGDRLLNWLEGVLATTRHVTPTFDTIRQRVGAESSAHELDVSELMALYAGSKGQKEVQTKRHLWARLLTAALGTQFEDDDDLFVEHTLLVNSAEIIAHALLGLNLADLAPATLLSGEQFNSVQIHGVVEADFFDWVLGVPGGPEFVKTLAQRLSRFDWDNVEHDVLKVLYESVIPAKTRKKLGEYYTPDWLAQRIVDEVVKNPLDQRVLDPACGSGTFLFHAVRCYLAAADEKGLSNKDAVEGVTAHVFGMDLHPVAVTLARVTYLLAIGRQRLRMGRGPINIPVYLGDSLQWRQPSRDMYTQHELVIDAEVDKTLLPGATQVRLPLDADQFHFAASLLNDFALFEGLINDLAAKAVSSSQKGKRNVGLANVFSTYAVPKDAQDSVTASFQTLCRLHDDDRDHIWGYYIRNFARPQWLLRPENHVDVLIGNPPWLAYHYMPTEMQRRFAEMSAARHLWHGGKLATQQDLSALFVVRAIRNYLKPGGTFGFVMPSAALRAGQFRGFRSGYYDGKHDGELRVAFSAGWDLRRLRPQVFEEMTCSVVLGTHSAHAVALPGPTEEWSGRLPDAHAHASWSAVADRITAGKITIAAAVASPDRAAPASEYAARFRNGASIFPRVFFVVERLPDGPLGLPSGHARVRSKSSANEHMPWKELPRLSGVLESEFVRPVHMGETILPYRALEPVLAVLPRVAQGLLDGQSERLDLYPGLAAWWRQAEAAWEANRSSEKLTLAERLDYQKGLSNQFPAQERRVFYTKSGMHLAAARVNDRRVVADHSLYWATVVTDDEGRFLCAILNAAVTTTRVRPLMSYGKDERHIDKYVWQLPIPMYDAANPAHVALAKLGKQAETLIAALTLDLSVHFAANRRRVREELAKSDVGKAIEESVSALLGGTASSRRAAPSDE